MLTRPVHSLRPILALLLASAASGCTISSEPQPKTDGPSAPASPLSIGATIGAQGGVIEGKAGTALEGVRLEIPAGALATDTAVSITLTEDPTPLAMGAQRVGPQLRIEPAGVALAAAATLRVPADPMWLAEFAASPADMKVWVRAGDSWDRIDGTAFDAATTTVTVPLSTLTTVAAGALISPKPVCNASCILAAVCKANGGTPEGSFCVSSMGVIHPTPELRDASFHMDGSGSLSYLTSDSNGVFATYVARPFDAAAFGAARFSQRVTGLSTKRVNAANRGNDGHFFIGTGSTGNVEFGFETNPVRIWNAGSDGRGAVMVSNGPFDLFSNQGVFQFNSTLTAVSRTVSTSLLDGTSAPVIRWAPGQLHTFVASSHTLLSGAAGNAVYDLRADSLALAGTAACAPPPNATDVLNVDQAFDGTVAMTSFLTDHEGHTAFATSVCKNNSLVDSVGAFGSIAFDGASALWVASTSSAEIVRRASDGTKSTALLTSAPVGSPDYLSRIPVAVRAAPGSDPSGVWVLTRGGELLHVTF